MTSRNCSAVSDDGNLLTTTCHKTEQKFGNFHSSTKRSQEVEISNLAQTFTLVEGKSFGLLSFWSLLLSSDFAACFGSTFFSCVIVSLLCCHRDGAKFRERT